MTIGRPIATAVSLIIGFGLIVIGLTPTMIVGAGLVLFGLFGPYLRPGEAIAQQGRVRVHAESGFAFGSPVGIDLETDEDLEAAEMRHLDEARRIASERRSRRVNRGAHNAKSD